MIQIARRILSVFHPHSYQWAVVGRNNEVVDDHGSRLIGSRRWLKMWISRPHLREHYERQYGRIKVKLMHVDELYPWLLVDTSKAA